MDARTGLGLTHHTLVTVVAEEGMTADGLATTLGVLRPKAGRALLSEHYPPVRAYLRPAPALPRRIECALTPGERYRQRARP